MTKYYEILSGKDLENALMIAKKNISIVAVEEDIDSGYLTNGYDDFEELKEEGIVETYDDFENMWLEDYPDEELHFQPVQKLQLRLHRKDNHRMPVNYHTHKSFRRIKE